MSDQKIEEGDKASWSWGSGNPSGTVAEVKEGEVSVTSHRGNEIKKTGDASDPAVHLERPGNDVVKKAHELTVEEKGPGNNGASEEKKDDAPESDDKDEKNGEEVQTGDKRKATEEPVVDEKDEAEKKAEEEDKEQEEEEKEEEKKVEKKAVKKAAPKAKKEFKKPEPKKQKTAAKPAEKAVEKPAENGDANGTAPAPKKPGRPKGSGTKKEKKEPVVGRTERKTRSQAKAEA